MRRITAALGPGLSLLVLAVLVNNTGWAELGRRLEVDPKTARAWAIAAIRALALVSKGR